MGWGRLRRPCWQSRICTFWHNRREGTLGDASVPAQPNTTPAPTRGWRSRMGIIWCCALVIQREGTLGDASVPAQPNTTPAPTRGLGTASSALLICCFSPHIYYRPSNLCQVFWYEICYCDWEKAGLGVGVAFEDGSMLLLDFGVDLLDTGCEGGHVALELFSFCCGETR